jgi:hypothetical protein
MTDDTKSGEDMSQSSKKELTGPSLANEWTEPRQVWLELRGSAGGHTLMNHL